MPTPLYEKHRPRQLADVAGHDRAKAQIETVLRSGWGGRAWWISGPSGTGKTTLALILARLGAADLCVDELDASALRPEHLHEIARTSQLYGMPPHAGRCWIVNEAHGLRRDSLRLLLLLLERIPEHVTWIFTTTTAGQEALFEDYMDAGPLLSRCLRLSLSRDELVQPAAKFVRRVARAEQLDGRPLKDYVALAEREDCNFRAMLQAVESGAMLAGPTAAALRQIKRPDHPPLDVDAIVCPACGAVPPRGKKYCDVACYTRYLKANKKRR